MAKESGGAMSRCKDCYWDCKRIEDFEHDCKDFQVKSRYDTFREQTATIDGLVEWCKKWRLYGRVDCDCCLYKDQKSCADMDCKAGIKAYWEGSDE